MQMKIERLDHLGVVAGILKELELSKEIDALLPPTDDMKASVGECVAAMILCGLGFSQTPLSLTPHFFEKLPVGFLLGNDKLQAQDLNHFKLGRSLEKLHEYGCEKLFAELSHKACQKESVETQWSHGDTTSFSFSGKYASDEESAEVEINHGYSRDHRPDIGGLRGLLNVGLRLPLVCEIGLSYASNRADAGYLADWGKPWLASRPEYRPKYRPEFGPGFRWESRGLPPLLLEQ